ncbi:protein-glutamine gamma-glutamyltransferase 2-like isoform X2 [Cyprinus carpio]|uniref:Protein-glutamine gamma-glutamyltransferase 2-like isoform X2 n=1 Tax=Cyprinus carpio TaxID=7962 RepID=A0A9R0BDK7_CYPCA|nr:protein-glutamine gamma-glutamyltransferase 2-like isoform X2 [Cyprinus carpio]
MASHNALLSGIDLQCYENNHAHRTEEMDVERLVVRRGQPFSVVLQCTEHIPQHQDHQLNLILHLGKNNEVVLKVSDSEQDHGKWWFSQRNAQGEVMLTLHSPADALVGLYSMTVVLLSADGQILEQTKPQTFYLLFNPWCKDDSVYLPSEELLQEYILNENGILYQGSWDDITTVPWNFGQVNANDDRGVVSGRWDGEYSDGVAPTRWTGSVPILRRWSEDGGQKVRYGQCWVFTGVACTVLRCLGIPTRCITNYSSAHDTDANVSVDYLFNDQLESVSEGRKDSIWNYHCWVESWMKRDDLPEGYNGWQVLDPTPQERSDGVFCCGPCPVRAVKEGEVGLKYDTPFVFSEVNADLIVWIVHPDGERIQVSQNSKVIGRNISTKSVSGDFREDITANYKYPEGSMKEREVYKKAGRQVGQKNKVPGQLELFIKHAPAVHGTDFDVIIEVYNAGREDTDAQLTVTSNAITYNSIHRAECQRKTTSLTVPAHKAHKEVLRLQYDHYGACVSEHHMIRVTALLQPTDQDNIILQETNIPLKMPVLHIKIIGKAIVSRKLTAYISFNNPLPVSLQGGVFTVEGAGLTEAKEIKTHGKIEPGQAVTVKFSFKPTRAGLRKLLVDFDSDRLRDVKGEATIIVRTKM